MRDVLPPLALREPQGERIEGHPVFAQGFGPLMVRYSYHERAADASMEVTP
jgi:hypothetical protein